MECKCMTGMEKDFLGEILQEFIELEQIKRNQTIDKFKRTSVSEIIIDGMSKGYDFIINTAQEIKDQVDNIPVCKE